MFIQLIGVPFSDIQRVANPNNGQLVTMPVSRVALYALDTEGIVWEYGGAASGWRHTNMTKHAPAESA